MSSSNKATAGGSGQKSDHRRAKEVNHQDKTGRIDENHERSIQGEEHENNSSSEGQMTSISEHDTWGFETMDRKPHYERDYTDTGGLSLTVPQEEETARQSSENRDGCTGFQGSSALEDWKRKSYTHEQWWNRK